MLTGPHIVILVMVFGFMMTAVNLLPPIVQAFQGRYQQRLAQTTRELDRFFVDIKIPHIIAGSLVLGALLGFATGSWVLAVTCTVVGIFAPKLLLSVWKDIRSSQFDLQLMDALILINNALRSGLDIATGIELVVTNLKPPISEEFNLVLNSYRLGASLEGALTEMTKRISSRTLETVVGAINIQREMGGNLIKTFEQLIQTIRDEDKLQKKIKAMSSQGKTQIAFLAAFPWLIVLGLYFMAPELIEPPLHDSMGQMVAAGLVIWEIIGILVTKNIVTVRV